MSACGYTITSAGGTKIQFSLQLEELSPMTVYEGSGRYSLSELKL